jgi:hypothetical protein
MADSASRFYEEEFDEGRLTRARQLSPACADPRQLPRRLRARPQRSRRGGRTGVGRPPRRPAATVYVDLEGGDDRPGRSSPRGARLQAGAQASTERAGARAQALSLPGGGDDLPDRHLSAPSRPGQGGASGARDWRRSGLARALRRARRLRRPLERRVKGGCVGRRRAQCRDASTGSRSSSSTLGVRRFDPAANRAIRPLQLTRFFHAPSAPSGRNSP